MIQPLWPPSVTSVSSVVQESSVTESNGPKEEVKRRESCHHLPCIILVIFVFVVVNNPG
jgi:hypothetical protein